MTVIACIGTGTIGRAWAIAFARGGCRVRLYDSDPAALRTAQARIADSLADLRAAGLLAHDDPVEARLEPVADLAQAVAGADHVQESAVEDLQVKRRLFAELDALAPPGAILASSTSAFMTSQFADVPHRPGRCLVAHPFNPPYLIPLVEISGGPSTAAEAVSRTRALFAGIGMSPVVVRKEIEGFLLNRLQAAVVGEALHLVGAGYCSAEDLDRAMVDGLGLRWAFMGPFMTGHLNAGGGYGDYMHRYGDTFRRLIEGLQRDDRWPDGLIDRIAAEMERTIPADRVAEGQRWRDRRLMEILKARQDAAPPPAQEPES